MVDNVALIGSTNWTQRSTKNQEINVLIQLSDEGIASLKERYRTIEGNAVLMGPRDFDLAQQVRIDRIAAQRQESPDIQPRHTNQIAKSHARSRNQPNNRRPRRSLSVDAQARGSGAFCAHAHQEPQVSSDSQ